MASLAVGFCFLFRLFELDCRYKNVLYFKFVYLYSQIFVKSKVEINQAVTDISGVEDNN